MRRDSEAVGPRRNRSAILLRCGGVAALVTLCVAAWSLLWDSRTLDDAKPRVTLAAPTAQRPANDTGAPVTDADNPPTSTPPAAVLPPTDAEGSDVHQLPEATTASALDRARAVSVTSLVGLVTDEEGQPIRGATVTVIPMRGEPDERKTKTDGLGCYELELDGPAFYNVEVRAKTFSRTSWRLVDVNAYAGVHRHDVVLERRALRGVSGRILVDGLPVSAEVCVPPMTADACVRTLPDGSFTITSPQAFAVRFLAISGIGHASIEPIRVAGTPRDATIALRALDEVERLDDHVVDVVVRYGEGHLPGDLEVTLWKHGSVETQPVQRTDDRSRFTVTAEGSYTVFLQVPGTERLRTMSTLIGGRYTLVSLDSWLLK